MSVIAAILGLAGAGFNLFQPIIQIQLQQGVFSRRIEISIFDMFKMGITGARELDSIGINWRNFITLLMEDMRYAQNEDIIRLCVGLAVLIAPVIAIIGVIQSASRKGGAGIFGFCAAVCGAEYFFVNNSMSQLPYEVRQILETVSSPQIFLLWAGLYGAAMLCALLINNERVIKEKIKIYISEPSKPKLNIHPAPVLSTPAAKQINPQAYEPVLGLDTEALIKRALLFLEDGEFYNAGRYIEQALNQDAENPKVHFLKLMFERRVHTVDELINKFDTPLEDEKLFQRAMRFADEAYKSELESYAKRVHDKIDKALAERKAEQERIQAEQKRIQAEYEAEQEKNYKEILELKETASSIDELEELCDKLFKLVPYKDTGKIYDKVRSRLDKEKDYQAVILQQEHASSVSEWRNIINWLKELNDYKDAKKLLTQAQERLKEAEAKAAKNRKTLLTSLVVLAAIAAGAFGFIKYNEHQEKIAREKAAEEERLAAIKARQDAMRAFFEERPDAYELIRNVPDFFITPVFSGMLDYINYDNGNLNYLELAKNIGIRFSWLSNEQTETQEAQSIAKAYSTKAANRFLGDYYSSAAGNDKHAALLKFNKLAEDGDKYAKFRMAQIYQSLNDEENASKWYARLVEDGTPQEKTVIANLFFKGETIPQDYKQAFELYTQAAEAGDAEAQNNIGWMYQNGYYVDKDYNKAFEWYLKAAENGMAVSQESVGYSYAAGRGVKQNYRLAADWYKKAAEQGREVAQYKLAELYIEGRGVSKDYNEALKWLRKAADQNNAPAMDKIGWLYQNGWGVTRDYNQAMQWYLKAAEQNNSNAQASIGYLYYEGLGVNKDLDKALEWYKKSAAQGNKIARDQVSLIELRLHGEQTRSNINTSDFPLPAIIAGNKVAVREGDYPSAHIKTVLNTGHPVSVSRRNYSSDYYFVRTASGTQGWVKGDYLVFKEQNLTYQEQENRRKSLPQHARVTGIDSELNVRNIPSMKGSKVVDKINNNFYIENVFEIFATEDLDWYHVRYMKDYEGMNWIDGWVSGKYIRLTQEEMQTYY